MEKRMHQLNLFINKLEEKNLLIEKHILENDIEALVRYISFNSLDIKANTLFVCKGAHFNKAFLDDAIDNGAICYVSETKYETKKDVSYIIVEDIRKTMAYIASLYYNNVWEDLTVIGITGTKGKSTTTYFMRYILDDYLKAQKKPRSGVISGIDNYDGIVNEESHLTTPEAFELYKHYNNAARSDIEYITMEVSSQALKYDRTLGVFFDVGCFLNIGLDHISDAEHEDFDDYFRSKLLLFKQCRTAVVNLNSDNADIIKAEALKNAEKTITFGLTNEADIYGYDIKTDSKGIKFRVSSDSFDEEFTIAMRGIFNVQNALAAIAISYALNIPLPYIKSGLKKAQVSGRMEIYTNKKNDVNVIVDYAHNKMSFESLFDSTKKEFPGKRIAIVFGCPGKKALGRRKELGEIAGKYSDKIYLTEEDAGEESIMQICEEIASHIDTQKCDCAIIPDRKEAIRTAIDNADKDTIVLVTGKGRETRQKRGIQYIDTPSDVDYVTEFLKKK